VVVGIEVEFDAGGVVVEASVTDQQILVGERVLVQQN
jgi:hypothetical protein